MCFSDAKILSELSLTAPFLFTKYQVAFFNQFLFATSNILNDFKTKATSQFLIELGYTRHPCEATFVT